MTDDRTRGERVELHEDRSRYVISVDGETAGFTSFEDRGVQRVFTHTVVKDRFSGRGLGSRLIAAALADTRASGLRVVAVCPFVAAYVRRHHDYDDILDPAVPSLIDGSEPS